MRLGPIPGVPMDDVVKINVQAVSGLCGHLASRSRVLEYVHV